MEKINRISRVILPIITFLYFKLTMRGTMDSSWNIVLIILSLIVFGLSFPSTIFAEKIIEIGDSIDNKYLKIAYYLVLPIILFLICTIISLVMVHINSIIPTPNEMGPALSKAFIIVFILIIMIIAVILPYVQAIIINILKKIIKE